MFPEVIQYCSAYWLKSSEISKKEQLTSFSLTDHLDSHAVLTTAMCSLKSAASERSFRETFTRRGVNEYNQANKLQSVYMTNLHTLRTCTRFFLTTIKPPCMLCSNRIIPAEAHLVSKPWHITWQTCQTAAVNEMHGKCILCCQLSSLLVRISSMAGSLHAIS